MMTPDPNPFVGPPVPDSRAAHMAELVRLLEAQGDAPTDHLRLMFRLAEFSLAGPWSPDAAEAGLDFAIKALGRSRVGASNLGVSSAVLASLRKQSTARRRRR